MPRLVAVILLLTFGAILESRKLASLQCPEIWEHLRVGSWILEQKSWPESGLFSQASNLRWRDFAWGYDAVSAAAYRMLGLRAVPALLMLFRVVLATVTLSVAGGRGDGLWSAVALSAVAQFVFFQMGPVSGYVSLILFGTALFVLLESRRRGDFRILFALPAIFFLWANLDIGVVNGVALLAIYLAALVVERMTRGTKWNWIETPGQGIPLEKAALAGAASLAASMLNPYGYHVYGTFWGIQMNAANAHLPGYTAMSFHRAQDYVVLLVVMTAFLALGLRRSRDLFLLSALIASAIAGFHAQGESGFVTLVAIAVIGCAVSPQREEAGNEAGRSGMWQVPATAGLAVAVVCVAFALWVPRERSALLARIAVNFPVRACDSIREQQLPEPLFNSYQWGSFVMWYLPEYPVAIDGRRGLYPEEEEVDYFKVMNVEIPYQSFSLMKQASTLLLDKIGPMGEALRGLPAFRVAYEDEISIVLWQDRKD